uniref:Rad21/Rec8-like protein N-terminal domain-containing protein n=1 Tax=Picea sitchensis TaxID=3332 RepID=B8LS19_PICSI|nr:unknown [Picea sitchensis]
MFYSQFILAKKGPLGTIWIAAHLERKLRKNQVADTDIGVSVDSILFPEVPIALRLSSHLLLGVVRIYSRKVNYLFNDCSETPGTSVQDAAPQITKQHEQVLMYESSTEMVCDGAVMSGAVVSEGREDCSGPHHEVIHNVALGKIVETPGTSVQDVVPEITKQHQHVVMYESSAEMDCDGAVMSGAVSSEGREDCSGCHHEVIHDVPQEDEAMRGSTANDNDVNDKIDFLGDAKVTECLGGDDDGQDEFEGKNNAHDAEKDQTQDNSGWSARTRAVSRYLKTVFEGMDQNSKKPQEENQLKLGLDRLLVGKTRKEAARMFFETLVLKTRDYVHVEQKDSFDDISLFPRTKLMKTNF